MLLKAGLFISLIFIGFTSSAANFNSALIDGFVDEQYLKASTDSKNWEIGEIVPVVSKNAKIGVFSFVEVKQIRAEGNGQYELKLKLIRQSRKYMIQKGDYIKRIDLSSENSDYIGSTDLVIKTSSQNISSKYKPLVHQGIFIGETAQTLYKNEFLVNFLGNVHYGLTDQISLNSYLTLNVLGRPNASVKMKVYDSESTTLAAGLSFVRLIQEDEANLNLNFYWDSISSDALISHIYLGLGLIKWNGAADAAAIKAVSSSSFQTGYEIILDNWDRFLVGPSYNFEKKTLGGYLSYVWIYDRFHFQLAINATDITQFNYDTKNGYFANFDLYWRF